MEQKVSIREFAFLIDKSETMVRKYIQKERIDPKHIDYANPTRPMIMVDSAKSDLENSINAKFVNNGSEEKRSLQRGSKAERTARAEASSALPTKPVSDDPTAIPVGAGFTEYFELNVTNLSKVKLIREIQMADVKIGEASKRLVPLADVYSALFKTGNEMREAMEAVPSRVVDDLLLAKTRHEMYEILSKEIHTVLTRLADAGRNLPEQQ